MSIMAEQRPDSEGIGPLSGKEGRARPRGGDALERETHKVGRRIFRLIDRHKLPPWHPSNMTEILMGLMMKDEDLRYRMLLFVDVFPALRSSSAVASHLEEYLTSSHLATGARPTGLSTFARQVGRQRPWTRAVIHLAARFGIARMGNRFIAGHTPEEVAVTIRKLEARGFRYSLDLLGEFVVSEEQANDFQRRYLEMVRGFGAIVGSGASEDSLTGPRVNISVKLSSLTSKFDPMDLEGTSLDVRSRLRPLFRAARENGTFLNIDMEKLEYRDATLQILLDLLDEEEFQGFENIGTVHQAYLRDSDETLGWFLAELVRRNQPMTIRLVKGAYWDSEQIWARQRGWPVPVYTNKADTDAAYERALRILLSNHRHVRTAVASHNVRSLAHAIALAKFLKVPKNRFEFQMLYGMAGPIMDGIRELGYPVRIYTPCGELIPGMSYLVRRILENTSNESFLRRRFAEHADEGDLLSNPKESISPATGGRS